MNFTTIKSFLGIGNQAKADGLPSKMMGKISPVSTSDFKQVLESNMNPVKDAPIYSNKMGVKQGVIQTHGLEVAIKYDKSILDHKSNQANSKEKATWKSDKSNSYLKGAQQDQGKSAKTLVGSILGENKSVKKNVSVVDEKVKQAEPQKITLTSANEKVVLSPKVEAKENQKENTKVDLATGKSSSAKHNDVKSATNKLNGEAQKSAGSVKPEGLKTQTTLNAHLVDKATVFNHKQTKIEEKASENVKLKPALVDVSSKENISSKAPVFNHKSPDLGNSKESAKSSLNDVVVENQTAKKAPVSLGGKTELNTQQKVGKDSIINSSAVKTPVSSSEKETVKVDVKSTSKDVVQNQSAPKANTSSISADIKAEFKDAVSTIKGQVVSPETAKKSEVSVNAKQEIIEKNPEIDQKKVKVNDSNPQKNLSKKLLDEPELTTKANINSALGTSKKAASEKGKIILSPAKTVDVKQPISSKKTAPKQAEIIQNALETQVSSVLNQAKPAITAPEKVVLNPKLIAISEDKKEVLVDSAPKTIGKKVAISAESKPVSPVLNQIKAVVSENVVSTNSKAKVLVDEKPTTISAESKPVSTLKNSEIKENTAQNSLKTSTGISNKESEKSSIGLQTKPNLVGVSKQEIPKSVESAVTPKSKQIEIPFDSKSAEPVKAATSLDSKLGKIQSAPISETLKNTNSKSQELSGKTVVSKPESVKENPVLSTKQGIDKPSSISAKTESNKPDLKQSSFVKLENETKTVSNSTSEKGKSSPVLSNSEAPKTEVSTAKSEVKVDKNVEQVKPNSSNGIQAKAESAKSIVTPKEVAKVNQTAPKPLEIVNSKPDLDSTNSTVFTKPNAAQNEVAKVNQNVNKPLDLAEPKAKVAESVKLAEPKMVKEAPVSDSNPSEIVSKKETKTQQDKKAVLDAKKNQAEEIKAETKVEPEKIQQNVGAIQQKIETELAKEIKPKSENSHSKVDTAPQSAMAQTAITAANSDVAKSKSAEVSSKPKASETQKQNPISSPSIPEKTPFVETAQAQVEKTKTELPSDVKSGLSSTVFAHKHQEKQSATDPKDVIKRSSYFGQSRRDDVSAPTKNENEPRLFNSEARAVAQVVEPVVKQENVTAQKGELPNQTTLQHVATKHESDKKPFQLKQEKQESSSLGSKSAESISEFARPKEAARSGILPTNTPVEEQKQEKIQELVSMKVENQNMEQTTLNANIRKDFPMKMAQFVRNMPQNEPVKTQELWHKHRFISEEGQALNIAVRKNADGTIQMQINGGSPELTKVIQQHVQEIRENLQQRLEVRVDIQFNQPDQGGSKGRQGAEQSAKSPGVGKLTGLKELEVEKETTVVGNRGEPRATELIENQWTA